MRLDQSLSGTVGALGPTWVQREAVWAAQVCLRCCGCGAWESAHQQKKGEKSGSLPMSTVIKIERGGMVYGVGNGILKHSGQEGFGG